MSSLICKLEIASTTNGGERERERDGLLFTKKEEQVQATFQCKLT